MLKAVRGRMALSPRRSLLDLAGSAYTDTLLEGAPCTSFRTLSGSTGLVQVGDGRTAPHSMSRLTPLPINRSGSSMKANAIRSAEGRLIERSIGKFRAFFSLPTHLLPTLL